MNEDAFAIYDFISRRRSNVIDKGTKRCNIFSEYNKPQTLPFKYYIAVYKQYGFTVAALSLMSLNELCTSKRTQICSTHLNKSGEFVLGYVEAISSKCVHICK